MYKWIKGKFVKIDPQAPIPKEPEPMPERPAKQPIMDKES